jgi:hypothetical protein
MSHSEQLGRPYTSPNAVKAHGKLKSVYFEYIRGRLKSSWPHLITPFTFSRSGWSVVSSASLAKGGTSKKRPSSHLHEVPTRGNKVSPRTLQTAVVDLRTELGQDRVQWWVHLPQSQFVS